MAVEARNLDLLQPQLLPIREMMNPIEGKTITTTSQLGQFSVRDNPLLPFDYNNYASPAPLKTNTAVKSDNSGLTYDISTSRKRSRDPKYATNSLYFLGEDLSFCVQSQQLDIERLISQHMEKVRHEIEEKRKVQARKIVEVIQAKIAKRLTAKEDEIQKLGKLNWALEEHVKTLCMENQIWRDMAQANEATASALRTNLEQVLAQVKKDEWRKRNKEDVAAAAAELDDAESCCGGSGNNVADDADKAAVGNKRLCKKCFKVESCVLLLPCRHLCLCTNCGSSLHVCPVCKSVKNASVHVNMS